MEDGLRGACVSLATAVLKARFFMVLTSTRIMALSKALIFWGSPKKAEFMSLRTFPVRMGSSLITSINSLGEAVMSLAICMVLETVGESEGIWSMASEIFWVIALKESSVIFNIYT